MSDITDLLSSVAPAVVAALDVDGVAYLNVGSVRSDVSRQSWRPLYELVAPPEWRKLADEQCETCDGEGKLYCDGCGGHLCPDPICGDPTCPNPHYCPDDCDGSTPDCPDCHEGRPVHTINVPCVRCARLDQFAYDRGFDLPGRRGHLRRSLLSAELINRDCDDGTVSVDVTVRLVQFQGCDPDEWSITPSGPPLSPGDFVAVFGKVERG